MSPSLSIVLGFRDRGVERVRRCLESLAAQSRSDFEVLFVDSGSHPDVCSEARSVVEAFPFARFLASCTRGHPWNRSHALNVGARQARGAYVMTTDVDMVFPPDFLDHVERRLSPDRVLFCYHHLLPRGFDDWGRLSRYRDRLQVAGRSALGACQVVSREVYEQLHGFDEYYRYWGVEDRDLRHRLKAAGLDEVWLNDVTEIFHQWHAPADLKTPGFLPPGAWGRMERHLLAHRGELVRNGESWGRSLRPEDRPVLGFLDGSTERLIDRPGLERIDVDPYDARDAGAVLDAFWNLASGSVLAVPGATLPIRSAAVDRIVGGANRLLRVAGRNARVGYRPNAVHAAIAELAHEPPDELADYYLGVPEDTGWSLLLRGEG